MYSMSESFVKVTARFMERQQHVEDVCRNFRPNYRSRPALKQVIEDVAFKRLGWCRIPKVIVMCVSV